jgi:hypothetical protein
MKYFEYRLYFDGVVVDVKLSFHRLCAGRLADGGGRTDLADSITAASVKGNNNSGSLNTIQQWPSGSLDHPSVRLSLLDTWRSSLTRWLRA